MVLFLAQIKKANNPQICRLTKLIFEK